MRKTWIIVRTVAWIVLAAGLAGCEQPQVYGSIGVSSFSGGGWGGGSSVGGSISVGGRIF